MNNMDHMLNLDTGFILKVMAFLEFCIDIRLSLSHIQNEKVVNEKCILLKLMFEWLNE